MTMLDIFQRELAGETISLRDPEYPKIAALIAEAQRITAEMNTRYRDSAEVRMLFSRLTGATVDESFWLLPPFYTDFGENIRVGRNVFVNRACEFMDRGGVTIGDDVLIGPKVNWSRSATRWTRRRADRRTARPSSSRRKCGSVQRCR
jgi:acetyltransferase-like isoleucine patch superfamily enzyme